MKRFFTKKSVACIFATILLFGFFSFNISLAQTNNNTQTTIENTGKTTSGASGMPINPTYAHASITYIYNTAGDGLWRILGELSGTGYSNAVMQQDYEMPTTKVAEANNFDTALAAWKSGKGIPEEQGMISGILKSIANYAAGAANLPAFAVWVGFLAAIHLVFVVISTISGLLFDLSISISIINIKDFFQSGGVVEILWTMIRDMLNISFIFILLYLAITKILGGLGPKAKTTLINVIMSAVLINFSMFITKILIDAGNLVAVQLFNQISPAGLGVSISGIILSGAGLMGAVKTALSLTGQINTIIALLLQIICMFVAIWTFLYAGLLLIGRTIALMFLMMTSPIGFVGQTIPGLGKLSSSWWSTLIDQILVAPVLMFFLLVVEKLIQNKELLNIINSSKLSISAAGNPPPFDVGGLILYIIIIIILLQGLKITKKLSGEVANITVKVAQAAVVGTAALVTAGVGGAVLIGGSGATAAASTAGGNIATRFAARLNFARQQIKKTPGLVGQFATGKLGKQPGIVGYGANIARENIIGGVKNVTGIDINKIQKTFEKNEESAKKSLATSADAITKPFETLKKELEATAGTLEKVRNNAADNAAKSVEKEKEHIAAENKLKTLEQNNKAAEEKVKQTEKILSLAQKGTVEEVSARAAHNDAITARDNASAAFTKTQIAVQQFEKAYKEKQKPIIEAAAKKAMEEMAEAMGIAGKAIVNEKGEIVIDTIQQKIKQNTTDLNKAELDRQKYIDENIRKGNYFGTLILNKKDREALANQIGTRNFKPGKNKRKALEDIAEILGEDIKGEKSKTEQQPKSK